MNEAPIRPSRTGVAAPLLLAAAMSSACALLSSDPADVGNVHIGNVPENLTRAEAEISDEDLVTATQRLVAVRDLKGLTPEESARVDQLLQAAVTRRIERYRTDGDASDLERLFDLDLPKRLRAMAGVAAAERMLADGRRVDAYKMILEVDEELPRHPARVQAGSVLSRAGLSLIRDDGRYGFFFSYRARGIAALEYLVLNYPGDPACAEAYAALAECYEDQLELDYAIERCEDLLVYHPRSPYSIYSEARLPYLRMRRLGRDDYDRSELLEARREIERWLASHAGHELEEWVLGLQKNCLERLAHGDLIVARHYRRYHADFGTRIHAERALAEATRAAHEEYAAEARALLDAASHEGGEEASP